MEKDVIKLYNSGKTVQQICNKLKYHQVLHIDILEKVVLN